MIIHLFSDHTKLGSVAHARDALLSYIDRQRQAMDGRACLIATCELYLVGGLVSDPILSPHYQSEQAAALVMITRAVKKNMVVVVGGIGYERGKCFNSVFVITDGKVIARHDKFIIGVAGSEDEQRYFASGATPTVVKVAGVSVGVSVGQELDNPDALKEYKGRCQLLLSLAFQPYYNGRVRGLKRTLSGYERLLAVPVLYLNGLLPMMGLFLRGKKYWCIRVARVRRVGQWSYLNCLSRAQLSLIY